MKKNFIVVLGLICTALLIGLFVRRQDEDAGERCDNAGGKRKIAASLPVNSGEERENRPVKSNVGGPARGGQNESVGDTRRDAAEEAESDDDAVERSIEQFDELTDKWSEPGNGISVTMDDVVDFSAKFRKIPKSRKMNICIPNCFIKLMLP